MTSMRIGGKQLKGHGTLPFSHKEVETRKVRERIQLEDLPKKVRKALSDEELAAFVASAKDGGLPVKSATGLEMLKKVLAHNNMDEVVFQADGDLYVASSAQLHRTWARGLGAVGDKVEWQGKTGVVIHIDNERDHGRKAALVALAATGIGVGASVGLGAFLPVAAAVPVKVLGGTASVVAQGSSAPAWLLALKGALPWAGGATGAVSTALGAVVGWFKRDHSGLEAISDAIKLDAPSLDENDKPAAREDDQLLLGFDQDA